jgi:hypothetical protein
MSEYQYYEFQAIDRRLTGAEIQTLRTYSTRAQISPTTFVNEYHWGDFKGDADAWMDRYFDAFLYFANWGTRILKLRLSARVLDPKVVRAYFDGDSSSFYQKGDHLVLTFASELEGDDDSYALDGGGLMSSLIPLRAELARGDRRALYLAWLAAMQYGGVDDDAIEPPVPAGLGKLSGSLAALADFLHIDPDLREVAARASAPRAASRLQRDEVLAWVGSLSAAEKDEILTRLVVAPDEAASVSAELLHEFCKARDASRPAPTRSPEPRRTVGELLRATEQRAVQRTQAAARKAAEENELRERETAAARVRHLDRLAGHEPRLWAEVERLVATKFPKSYEQAVIHLVDLRDLAARKGCDGSTDFATRLEHLRLSHVRKPSLLDRFARAGL